MSKQDEWGYTNLELKLTENKKEKFNFSIISYYFSENDSYSYMNHGAQREIIINIDKFVNIELLKILLEKVYFPDPIQKLLKKMIENNKIESGTFSDENYW